MKISLRHQFVLVVAPLALLLIALVAVLVGAVVPIEDTLEEIKEDLAETVYAEDVTTSLSEEVIATIQGQPDGGCETTLAALARWRAFAADDGREDETLDDLATQVRRFDFTELRESDARRSNPATMETALAETLALFDRTQATIRRARSKEELDLENRIATVGQGIPAPLQSSSLRRDITHLQLHVRGTATAAMFLQAIYDEKLAYELATLSPEVAGRRMIDARIFSARTEAANLFLTWREVAARRRSVDERDHGFEEIVREYERFGALARKIELRLQETGQIERRSLQGLQRLTGLVDESIDSEHQEAGELLDEVEHSIEVLIVGVSVCSLAVIALAIGLPWLFGQRLIRALASFEKSAWQVRDGQLSARVDVHSNDELGQAADSFNAMAEDLQHAATARAQSDERFHLAAQATKDIIWDWDFTSDEIRVNEASKRLLGFDEPGTVPLMAWHDAIHPDDIVRVLLAIREALETGAEIWSDQYRFRRADGSYAFVLDRASIVRTADGRPARLIGAMVDITAQKEAQQAIADLNRRNELLLDSVADGIVGFDLTGNITVVNPAAALALGSELTEMRGQQVHTLLHGQNAAHDWSTCPFRTALASAEAQRNDADSFRRADRTRIATEYVCSAIQDENGSVHGAVLAFRDVSERTALQRMKAEFVSTVSHELRTPLTSIRGSLGLLASGILGKTSERGQRMLDIAISNTDRLVRLINDILDIERLDSGRGVLTRKRIDSGELIEQAIEVMKSMSDKAGVTLVFEKSSLPVYGDSDRLMQMLTNLVSNAIKFSHSGGEVSVRAEPDHGMLRFAVSDRGRGIPADKLSLIFERFQQVDASDAREKGGTGLGLAICRSIVQQHGGRIWAESVLGEGSTFYFTIPLDISGHSDASPHDVAPILICDDDPSVREVLAHILRARGYAVVCAGSGEEAIAMACERRPRVIILDLMMEGMSGWETMAVLRKQPLTKEVPILIASVLSPAEAIAVSGIDVDGIDGWIQKPFDERALFESLEQIADEGGVPKILVIEDDPDLARTLIASFERFGLIVDHARNGREALEMALALKPNLIILDLGLPELDGFGVVQALRNDEALCNVPVVVYSGAEVAPDRRPLLELGPTEFLIKSRISPKQFEEKVMGLLGILAADKENAHVEAHFDR